MKNYFTTKGKLAGTLKDGIYRKKVHSKLHRMRMFDAYGVDKKITLELEKEGCKEVRIKEVDTEIVYATPFESFIKNGIERNFDGLQIFLPVKHFTVENMKQASLL